jgi:hypothetical protein
MAYADKKLVKLRIIDPPTDNAPTNAYWLYHDTATTLAALGAAGFFNPGRRFLKVGDVILLVGSDGSAHVNVTAVPDAANVAPNILVVNNSAKKMAFGQAVTVTAADTIATGLATVSVCLATLEDAPVLTCDQATAVKGDQAGAPVAGSIIIKTWKRTAAGDATPIAATTFGKKVNWIAIGP